MRKTLLLVFIHGFKGGEDTFGSFPEHLRALVSHALPKIDIVAVTYPKFDTRGELKECVGRFREWLQNKVIDLEVARSTPSPTIDPSVHVLLVGHSMGGIVGAEAIMLLASEQPLPPPSSISNSESAPNFPSNTTQSSSTSTSHPTPNTPSPLDAQATASTSSFMFPHITGLLAFDTPFLGISPGVVAHGAESHYKTASQAYKTFSEVSSIFGWGSSNSASSGASTVSKAAAALPAPPSGDAAAAPSWQSWGKYAMFAGAAGAVAAGASAAIYSQKDKLSLGWSWATSHLEFVGCLARGEEMKQRVQKMTDIEKERNLGFIDFYTLLGKGAREGYGASETVLGAKRTFCSLPKRILEGKPTPTGNDMAGLQWKSALNDKARDEIGAHVSMFFPRDNPHFYTLGTEAKEWITHRILSMDREHQWYEESDEQSDSKGGFTLGEVGDDGWEKPDYDDESVKEKMREKNKGTSDGNIQMREEVGDEDGEGDLESSIIVDKSV